MNRKEIIQKKIIELQEEQSIIQIQIDSLKKELEFLAIKNNNDKQCSCLPQDVKCDLKNEDLFIYYLINIKGLVKSTAKDYVSALKTMKELMEKHLKTSYNFDFFTINDSQFFGELIDLFNSNADLIMINQIRHHDISAAFNNYYNFLISMEA